jgi:hypothetical protein
MMVAPVLWIYIWLVKLDELPPFSPLRLCADEHACLREEE